MAGIYVHIPFCKTRCIYCDFYSNTSLVHESYLKALEKEINLQKNYLIGETVDTIYFGGGTPSQLSIEELNFILTNLSQTFSINKGAEITLEANPDDLNSEYVEQLKNLGVNRLSLGIQTFDDDSLRFLKRRHSGLQAYEVVKMCQNIGFSNISVDLMYGLPNQSVADFESNIRTALELNVQHISAYHLTYEKGTKLFRMLENKEIRTVEEETSLQMFSSLIHLLKEGGFEHYEISNFAKNGFYSRHNTAYWKGINYLGLGPSAHSYNGVSRQWNISSLNKYSKALNEGRLDVEIEPQTPQNSYNDYVMTGLRTMWGIDLEYINTSFGPKMKDYCLKNAQPHIESDMLTLQDNQLKLSSQGIFLSDGIMSDLMWVE